MSSRPGQLGTNRGFWSPRKGDLRPPGLFRIFLTEGLSIEVLSITRLQRTCFNQPECAGAVRAPLGAEEANVRQPLLMETMRKVVEVVT
jgi:hypothetical protein